MKVIAAINGSLVSESSAFLALNYAKNQGIDLILLHVKNHKDDISEVQNSASRIKAAADDLQLNCETVILKGHIKEAIKEYLEPLHIDSFFCSTRMHKNFITNSFSEAILKMKLNTNIAVIRIVHSHQFKELSSILLPIKETKLSVYKFTFVSTLASTYKSNVHILSISTTSKNHLAKQTLSTLRERSAHINFQLRHYLNLARLMPFKLNIKHDFSTNESNSILKYMAAHDSQLVIIGAKRLSFFSLFKGEKPIERLMRETSTNLIAFYPKED